MLTIACDIIAIAILIAVAVSEAVSGSLGESLASFAVACLWSVVLGMDIVKFNHGR